MKQHKPAEYKLKDVPMNFSKHFQKVEEPLKKQNKYYNKNNTLHNFFCILIFFPVYNIRNHREKETEKSEILSFIDCQGRHRIRFLKPEKTMQAIKYKKRPFNYKTKI